MHRPSVALLVVTYDRPAHLERCLMSLLATERMNELALFVRADGARQNASAEDEQRIRDTRRVARRLTAGHAVDLIEYPENIGVVRMMSENVAEILDSFESIVIVEDDLIVSRAFLDYMLRALALYRDDPGVLAVSGYMWPVAPPLSSDTFFMPVPHYWGWGTWCRAWRRYVADGVKLAATLNARRLVQHWNSFSAYQRDNFELLGLHNQGVFTLWDILWSGSVVLHDGLTLYPAHSLVRNCGFDNTGLHCRPGMTYDFARQPVSAFCPGVSRQPLRAVSGASDLHQYVRRHVTSSASALEQK